MFSSYKDSVAIYLRKSRMDPDSENINETLARHEDTLFKFAQKLELNIVKVFKEVVSGDGLFTRPEMLRLLHDIEEDKYSGVLCMEIDRLGRSSQKDGGIILETFQEHNVFIITPNKTYDLSNEIDEQSVEMQSFIARQELKSIKRRLRKGVEKTIESGGHIAEPPYGYRRVYLDKRPTLEICEEEAKVVRMIFDMYVNQGMGGQVIADKLNKMGYSPRKNDHFSRTTISWYLKNPTYIGKVVWNKGHHIRKKTPSDKHRTVLNPPEKWIVSDGLHQPIISQELFDKAQEIIKRKTHPPSYTGELRNPFAGLIYCKKCGFAIQRQNSSKKGIRLLCPSVGCMRSIRMEHVEKYILNSLRTVFEECKQHSGNQVKLKTDDNHAAELLKTTIKDIEKEIQSLQKQRAYLHELLEKQVYDIATFLERNNVLSTRMYDLEESLEDTKKQLSNLQILPPIQEALPILKKLLEEYDELDAAEKNRLLKLLIKRIDYQHTPEQKKSECTLEIYWYYSI